MVVLHSPCSVTAAATQPGPPCFTKPNAAMVGTVMSRYCSSGAPWNCSRAVRFLPVSAHSRRAGKIPSKDTTRVVSF